MRKKIASLLVIFISVHAWTAPKDEENIFVGEWVVIPASSPASFVFSFLESGRVVNKTTKTAGTYELLQNNRILMEFPTEILIMEYFESDGSILLNGHVGVQPQPISISLAEPTEENRKEAQETYDTRFKAQQEAVMRVQRQSIEVAVRNNLRQLASAAQMYMLERGATEVSYGKLLEEKYIETLTPLNGESYDDLFVDMDTTEIKVLDADGTLHAYTF